MRYSLRTLSVLLAVGPVALWGIYSALPRWERDDRTNVMQAPRVTEFWPPASPTADLDMSFDQSAFNSSAPQRSGPIISASLP